MADVGEVVYDFDVAVSFAGEDREFVEAVVKDVEAAGFQIFYDNQADLWGQELTEFFADVYERRSRFAVMFVSQHYAQKVWTRGERRSILARAMAEESVYLLPVRMDDTSLPGLRATIGYLDGRSEGPTGVARALIAKLGAAAATGDRRFNGRVPRSAQEVATLLGERPPAWEYLLFSYLLVTKLEKLDLIYRDNRLGFTLPTTFLADDDFELFAQQQLARVRATTTTFERLLLGQAQEEAFGLPGESGDPILVEHLAARLIDIYEELLNWSNNIRSQTTQSDAAGAAAFALSNYAWQPIESIRAFVYDHRQQMDGMHARLLSGENVALTMSIKFAVPDAVKKTYDRELKALAKHRRKR